MCTMPFGCREGINIFLDGFVPTENLRFRTTSLTFKVAENAGEEIVHAAHYQYPAMQKTLGGFKLTIEPGSFSDSEIIVMLGENGTGKTTFVRMLAGVMKPDGEVRDNDNDRGTITPHLPRVLHAVAQFHCNPLSRRPHARNRKRGGANRVALPPLPPSPSPPRQQFPFVLICADVCSFQTQR